MAAATGLGSDTEGWEQSGKDVEVCKTWRARHPFAGPKAGSPQRTTRRYLTPRQALPSVYNGLW